jgi:hypothetical protein
MPICWSGKTHILLTLFARSIFFTKSESDGLEGPLSALIKSDRKALQSLASVLRLETDGIEETILHVTMVDLNDLTTLHSSKPR